MKNWAFISSSDLLQASKKNFGNYILNRGDLNSCIRSSLPQCENVYLQETLLIFHAKPSAKGHIAAKHKSTNHKLNLVYSSK